MGGANRENPSPLLRGACGSWLSSLPQLPGGSLEDLEDEPRRLIPASTGLAHYHDFHMERESYADCAALVRRSPLLTITTIGRPTPSANTSAT